MTNEIAKLGLCLILLVACFGPGIAVLITFRRDDNNEGGSQ